MQNLKLYVATLALAICGVASDTSASAQVRTYYSTGYAIPAYAPNPVVYAPPMVVARPIVVAPVPLQVVTAYRPVVPTHVAPAAVYSMYRPVVPAPIYAPPTYGAVARSWRVKRLAAGNASNGFSFLSVD